MELWGKSACRFTFAQDMERQINQWNISSYLPNKNTCYYYPLKILRDFFSRQAFPKSVKYRTELTLWKYSLTLKESAAREIWCQWDVLEIQLLQSYEVGKKRSGVKQRHKLLNYMHGLFDLCTWVVLLTLEKMLMPRQNKHQQKDKVYSLWLDITL